MNNFAGQSLKFAFHWRFRYRKRFGDFRRRHEKAPNVSYDIAKNILGIKRVKRIVQFGNGDQVAKEIASKIQGK